jgi:RNA polymerase sigma factor (sigma-70 family)
LEQPVRLIQGCIAGDRNSQRQLYELYSPKMFTVCLRYSESREEAEEILQEGFLKVFESISKFRFEGSFEGWVRKIMVNSALQKYRRRYRLHAVVDIESTVLEDHYHGDIVSQISMKELLHMVQQLTPAYRTVFNLYVFEGYKHREIAELLGVSEGTSKSNLSDARSVLQRMINNSLKIAKHS